MFLGLSDEWCVCHVSFFLGVNRHVGNVVFTVIYHFLATPCEVHWVTLVSKASRLKGSIFHLCFTYLFSRVSLPNIVNNNSNCPKCDTSRMQTLTVRGLWICCKETRAEDEKKQKEPFFFSLSIFFFPIITFLHNNNWSWNALMGSYKAIYSPKEN